MWVWLRVLARVALCSGPNEGFLTWRTKANYAAPTTTGYLGPFSYVPIWNRAKITHPISQPGSKWWLLTTEQCSRLRPMHNVLPNLSTANSHGRRRSSLHDLRGMIEHRTSKNGHSFNRTWHARRKLPLPDASRSPLFF